MPTPLTKLTTAQLTTLGSTTIANAKPYQLQQVLDAIARTKWDRGSNSDVSAQPTISTIITALGSNNP